ncbi:MAG: hypothetical protein A2V66_14970 [Ignavibacteria bacterium RBG_13_36_8]|nr:MAG: hypothetical protein A2V66_14970 [Ignavibacteria bacterium RBG_13_36_8]
MKSQIKIVAAGEKIYFSSTSENDLDFILSSERHPDNKKYIRCWTEDEHINAMNSDNYAHWTIRTNSDGKRIGYIILTGIGNPQRSIEFKRIVINEKGKGLGKESVRLLIKVAFEIMNANRLWLDVIDYNERAHNLYRSLGFIDEGKIRDCEIIDGNLISFYVMSILKKEYEQLKHTILAKS